MRRLRYGIFLSEFYINFMATDICFYFDMVSARFTQRNYFIFAVGFNAFDFFMSEYHSRNIKHPVLIEFKGKSIIFSVVTVLYDITADSNGERSCEMVKKRLIICLQLSD